MLVVTATAPTVAQASHASTISGQFSAWMSTSSPGPMPRSREAGGQAVHVGRGARRRSSCRGVASRAGPRPGRGGRAWRSAQCVEQPGDVLAVGLERFDGGGFHADNLGCRVMTELTDFMRVATTSGTFCVLATTATTARCRRRWSTPE